jgi:hypothetical protein
MRSDVLDGISNKAGYGKTCSLAGLRILLQAAGCDLGDSLGAATHPFEVCLSTDIFPLNTLRYMPFGIS